MISRFLPLALGAVLLAGCARTAPPASSPVVAALKPSSISLTVSPAPPRQLDTSTFTVTAADETGKPLSGATVTVDLTMPTMAMPKNEIVCKPSQPGVYSGQGRFTMEGDWQASVTVIAAGRTRTQTFPFTVK